MACWARRGGVCGGVEKRKGRRRLPRTGGLSGVPSRRLPPMLCVPSSLDALLVLFGSCFTAPSFQTFRALVVGQVSQTGLRTVTGMLVGSRLVRRETGMEKEMKTLYVEGVAIHDGPESCAGVREGVG